jgi:AcrR family transcriptional regulator
MSAVIDAAIRLFAQRGPSAVSLRDIAKEAGVNYGLIHRYFGSRDDVLRAAFEELADRATHRLLGTRTIEEMWPRVWVDVADDYARMVAWSLLEGHRPQDHIRHAPSAAAIAGIVARYADQSTSPTTDFDPRVVAAALVVTGMGWKLFAPFVTAALDLDDRDQVELFAELGRIAESLVQAIYGPPPPG